jgi:ankyrin repeat protein
LWDVTYTDYLPTTVTLGKTGIPWNNDGTYTVKKGGLSALHFAVQKNDLASVRLLLDAGAPVDSPTADGTTPLLTALYKWDQPKSTFIPGQGAPATAGSSQQFRPNLAIASFLLERGAAVRVRDGSGYTPLHGASLAVAKAARTGARLRGAYGGSAAALALGADEDVTLKLDDALALVERLLKASADPNQQTIYATGGPAGDVRINPAPAGSSPMHIAASSGSVALVKLLAAHGGNPNLLRKDGHTPFSVSVLAGDVAVVKQLAESGAEVNGRWSPQDKIPDPVEAITLARENQTALHLAAIEGKPELLTYLNSLGLPLDAKNSMDETPLDLADKQERYRFAIQIQGADGDVEKIKKIARKTGGTDCLKKLAAR